MSLKNKQFVTNASENKPVMVQCRTLVRSDAIRRESIDGVEHIIVKSSTLPDDIVMNGMLYPAEEIAKSFDSLELTLAPIEHPQIDGHFISASDPRAINNFHAGAFNMNVHREGGRVHIEKFINVQEALKTERGRRLLDRVEEIETNSQPRPMHTSVGVFLLPELLDEIQTNAEGQEFNSIARDMVFDHDAILLDSVGAAQPHQGVGMAVNKKGDELQVLLTSTDDDNHGFKESPLCNEDKARITETFNEITDNAEGMSFSQIEESIRDKLRSLNVLGDDVYLWVVDIFPADQTVIYEMNDELFTVPFTMSDDGQFTIVNTPLIVERRVTFSPKINQSEGNAMNELILNALAAASIDTAGMDDAALLAAYSQLQANQSESNGNSADNGDGIAEIVENALKPLAEKIDGLEQKLSANTQAEIDSLADVVANSGKYTGLDADSAKLLGLDKLKEMAGNCETGHGLAPSLSTNAGEDFASPSEMPQ